MSLSKFYPVIHLASMAQGISEAEKAFDAGADGTFFIHHGGDDALAVSVAEAMKKRHPSRYVGINLLASSAVSSFEKAIDFKLDAIWADSVGIDSDGMSKEALVLSKLHRTHPFIDIYAGVAFKYQPTDTNPTSTTYNISAESWVPTTSGARTGSPAALSKIQMLSAASSNGLGLASGVTLGNVDDYLPYVTHFFVASSIEFDAYTLDFEKMAAMAGKIHRHGTGGDA